MDQEKLKYVLVRVAIFLGVVFTTVTIWDAGTWLVSMPNNAAVVLGVLVLIITVVAFIGVALRLGQDVLMKLGLLVVAALMLNACGWTNVPPGEVGIKVDYYGRQKGVEDFPLQTGVVLYNPLTTRVIQYPTFMQQVKWTKSPTEGRAQDESFYLNTVEGVQVNFDVALGYHLEAAKVPTIYMQFRTNAETMTDNYIRNMVRDGFSREMSKMKVIDVYGTGKSAMEKTVTENMERQLGPIGIHIDYVSIIGSIRVPANVEQAINLTIEATQQAQRAQNLIAQKTAEAQQAIAEANGVAQAQIIKAKAQADANTMISNSVTPELVQYYIAKAWNGQLPQFTGGAMPLLQIPNIK